MYLTRNRTRLLVKEPKMELELEPVIEEIKEEIKEEKQNPRELRQAWLDKLSKNTY